MNRPFRTAALLLFVGSLARSLVAQEPYAEEIRRFEEFAETQMRIDKMPGLSVAFMKDDFVWSRGFGYADLENKVPATAESSYRLASVTKPMTAIAVLKLAEEGKLDLDAEVQKYVSYFPKKSKPITVRQLLSHLGGISHYQNYDLEGRIREKKSTREAIAIFESFDLVNEPGTVYSYSSYGYNLLGAVIESASGKPYGVYMREAVWTPLGMTNTRMDDPQDLIPNRVRGYRLVDGQVKNSEYVDISSRFAAGGTRSTVRDLIKFVHCLETGKLLKPQTLESMWTAATTTQGRLVDYGYGWGVSPVNGRFQVSHSGSQQETRTLLVYIPGERFALALASNFEDANLPMYRNRLFALLFDEPWNLSAYVNSKEEETIYRAAWNVFTRGLAYYDRHDKPMTADRSELREAFRYFNRAIERGREWKVVKDEIDAGEHPAAGEPFTKIGSFMASELARSGKSPEEYHRSGSLAFFDDYVALYNSRGLPRTVRFGRSFESLISTWSEEWKKLEPVIREGLYVDLGDVDQMERIAARLQEARIKPFYGGGILALVERAYTTGEPDKAFQIAKLGYQLYPNSAGATGAYGLMYLLSGDRERGAQLLRKSVELDKDGYARASNLRSIARWLVGKGQADQAIKLLEITAELHPDDAATKKALSELRPGS